MSLKADHAEATRRALLKAARHLFTRKGYSQTAIDEIVQRARVTKGALYHHFADKAALFRAAYEQLEAEIAARVSAAAAEEDDPFEQLRHGCGAFLDTCLDPAVRQIVLLDGPSVLGWKLWREIDASYALGLIKTGLQDLVEAGIARPQPVDPLAHLLLGALNEAGMLIANSRDRDETRAEVGRTLEGFLEGLRDRA
jgi:AcrR family transcriptional regulator